MIIVVEHNADIIGDGWALWVGGEYALRIHAFAVGFT